MSDERELAAGDFSSWLRDMRSALRGEQAADVPCDGCTACCTASQFIHIEPDETDTLAHVPPALLFPAPGRPRGHLVLGYDERGHCPMLVDDRCSIYEQRPRTCRTYDCRIFAATGLDVANGDETKLLIGQRASRWKFSYPSETDREAHAALETVAASLRPQAKSPTQLAVRAIGFMDRETLG